MKPKIQMVIPDCQERVVATDENIHGVVNEAIAKYGPTCDLNFIDVSKVKNMSFLFKDSPFNGDISKWNVSSVENMLGMFLYSQFNGDISQWDVSHVENMAFMFFGAQFNGDISRWDVSSVAANNMENMFTASQFNGDIILWIAKMKKNGISFLDLGYPRKGNPFKDIEV